MAETRDQELLARIEALEAENARLRVEAEAPPGIVAPVKVRRSGRGRVAIATVLVIVGVLLAPIAVLGGWAKTQLVDTDTFVATFAPLADDPEVQAFIADEATTAILDSVDIEGYTTAVFDAIKDLGLPPRAEEALGLLEGPATQGIQSLVGQLVNRFVTSDAFGDIFEQALRVTHTQTIAALQGDPDAVLDIGASGELGIQLGPIVAEVKQRLIDAGVGFASAIPEVDRTIVVAQSDALPTVRIVYALAVSAGTWLPWVALAFLIAGILVAPRRRTAIIWTSSALAVSMLILGSGFGIARLYFLGTIAPGIMPAAAAEVIYDKIVDRMVATTVALAIFAVAVAVIAWLSGPWALPRKLRGFTDAGFGAVRGAAAERGLTTGAFGAWLGRQRVLVFSLIALVAVAVILFSRPISTSLVVWTIVIALLLVALVELLQRPADEVAAADAAAAVASEQAEAEAAEALAAEDGQADTAVLVETSGAVIADGDEDAKTTDVLDLGGEADPRATGPKKRGRPAD
ncbi:hypothetical protein [Agromyces aureus]|uniref:Integral membrane protein n=1 Tax=Agromyces aureus TaxID=453304 RepID=A0A191WDN1_9MICO|nr:hypothetical protein [Agromyces aureus]ANJ26308.1 hypothetical protein ATC03_05815 [Agromyces aureus]